MANWLNHLKFKNKIFLLMLTVILIFLFVETGNRQAAYHNYDQELYRGNAQNANTYIQYIEAVFDRIEKLTFSMVGDKVIQDKLLFISQYPENQIPYGVAKEEELDVTLQNSVWNYANREIYFDGFALIARDMLYSYGAVEDKDKLKAYTEVADGKNAQMQSISKEGQLILVREIRELGTVNHLGYVIMWVNYEAIVEDIKSTFEDIDPKFALAVYDGDICLYSEYEKMKEYRMTEDGWYIDGDDFILVQSSSSLGHKILVRVDYSEIRGFTQNVYVCSLMITLITVCMMLLLIDFATKYVVKDLDKLVLKMDDFGEGNLPVNEERGQYQNRGDEIGKLFRHFYRMTEDYKKLTDDYYNNQILLLESEFSRLQKQIQPHFLYNTLSAIFWSAYSNDDMETANMVEVLSRVMRRITDNSESLIKVESDLQIAEDYLTIQKYRYGNKLDIQVNVSNYTRELMIPPISIQPLVENAVTHAMEQMTERCRISIYDRECEDGMEIIVEDNGPGCAEDILERASEDNSQSKGCGIALRNINTRLKYVFSQEYGLRLKRLEHGMQVIIKIPNRE